MSNVPIVYPGVLGPLARAVQVVVPTGDTTTDTASLLTAITNANGLSDVLIAGGTCSISSITLPASASVHLDDDAILFHASGAANDMFVVPAGFSFALKGGTVDGNESNQNFARCIVRCVGLHTGSRLDITDVSFLRTRAAASAVYEFGGEINIEYCSFAEMGEHDGVLQHATCALSVQSGEVGARGRLRFNYNDVVGTDAPVLPGGSPGGVFFAPTTDYVAGLGNDSTFEAIGNYFWGIGQNCGGNDIAPLHTYPVTLGARFVANYFEKCGFSAIAAKSVIDFVCTDNVIVDGVTSTQNDATSGAIYYTPGDHAAANSRPRAVIQGNIIDNPGGTPTAKQNGISVIGTTTSYADQFVISDNVIYNAGIGIYLDYVTSGLISQNHIIGGSGGSNGTEHGIEPNHVVGTLRMTNNHVDVSNGYGIVAINGVSTAKLIFEHNYIKSTHATTYALLARGAAYEIARNNTLETDYYAVSVDTDGSHNVGALSWDRSNVVIGTGLVNIAYASVNRLVGNIQMPDYTPTAFAGATSLWDGAAGITSASGKVSAWVDRIGGFSFTQPTEANKPSLILNAFDARSGIRFNGSTSWMSTVTTVAQLIAAATGYYFLVLSPIAVSRSAAAPYDNDGVLLDTNGVTGVVLKNVAGLPNALGINHGGAFDSTPSGTLTLSRPILLGVRHSGGRLDVRVNAGAWTGNVASTDTTPTAGQYRLGAGYDNAHYANFDIGAILTLNSALSASDDYKLLRWAQQEFGVSF